MWLAEIPHFEPQTTGFWSTILSLWLDRQLALTRWNQYDSARVPQSLRSIRTKLVLRMTALPNKPSKCKFTPWGRRILPPSYKGI